MTTQTNKQVIAHIGEAMEARATLHESLRRAAAEAAVELDTSKDAKEAVSEVVDRYAEHFTGDGAHNDKAVFGDFLLLHYDPDAPVTIVRRGQSDDNPTHATASEAIAFSKHDMRKAAKAVREDLGISRASGGGRKPRPNQNGPAKDLLTSAKSAVENLLKSEAGITALRELLRDNGYQLRKVSK